MPARERERKRCVERETGSCVLAYLTRLAVACQASKLAVSDKDNIMAAAAAVAKAAIKTFTLLGVTFLLAACQRLPLPPSPTASLPTSLLPSASLLLTNKARNLKRSSAAL